MKMNEHRLRPGQDRILWLWGRTVLPFMDLVLTISGVVMAYAIRFDGHIPSSYSELLLRILVIWIIVRFFWFFLHHFYSQAWQYASIREALVILSAVTVGTVTLYVSNFLLPFGGIHTRVPRSIFIIEWLLAMLFLGGSRLLIRVWHDNKKQRDNLLRSDETLGVARNKRILVVGAGDAGAMAVREMRQATYWQVVAFVDDNPKKIGTRVAGVPVLGDRYKIPAVVQSEGISEILVAMPSVSRAVMREIVAIAQKTGCPVRTFPAIYELIDGKVTVNQIREVSIEDLLGREPVSTDMRAIAAYLSDRTVLVTGAGGSIGSELCRQIAKFKPERLIILGHGENSIFAIENELRRNFPNLALEPCIADIRDRSKILRIFAAKRPNVVFHAAAHKHVPLMEANPDEAAANNVFGTKNLVDAADLNKVERFVMISTDKAVHPVSVMGASKRVAEMVVQNANSHSKTRFVIVRFGNVLGSRGSVIPTFKQQIASGGPVTVTHPDMRRYFMTIPEASQLVIQAGALGEGGEIFLLNMGEPVRIMDLANDMIRLSGFEPGVDIQVVITGTRPGEKLSEELYTDQEDILPTSHPKIVKLRSAGVGSAWLDLSLRKLQDLLATQDGKTIREELLRISSWNESVKRKLAVGEFPADAAAANDDDNEVI